MRIIKANYAVLTNNKFALFLVPLFAVFIVDGSVGYAFPIIVESRVNSNIIVGLIMAFSSLVGIVCDFLFPELLKKTTWKQQLLLGVIVASLFPIFTFWGRENGQVWPFLFASAVWGIYFELLAFAQQNYVVAEDKMINYSRDWAVIFIIIELTKIAGPIIGATMLIQDTATISGYTLALLALAIFITLLLTVRKRKSTITLVADPINSLDQKANRLSAGLSVIREFKFWGTLGKVVFPVIVVGVVAELIEATFWTFGGLYAEEIGLVHGTEWLIIGMYQIPLLLGALVLSRLNITQRKKRISQIALVMGGLALSTLYFTQAVAPTLLIIFVAGLMISFVAPLNEAVYSDLLSRLGKNKMHLLGLAKANSSLAYIVGPIALGILSDASNYRSAFAAVGLITVVLSAGLLIFTPRKLRLPQTEIKALAES